MRFRVNRNGEPDGLGMEGGERFGVHCTIVHQAAPLVLFFIEKNSSPLTDERITATAPDFPRTCQSDDPMG